MKSIKRISKFFGKCSVIITLILYTTGCGTMTRAIAVKVMPSYDETMAKASALAADQGRVVVYYLRQGWYNNMGSINVEVDSDYQDSIMNMSFVFYDLSPGRHSFSISIGRNPQGEIKIDVEPGKTVYIQIDGGFIYTEQGVVDESTAMQYLPSYCHNYKDYHPANKRKKAWFQ